MPDYKQMYLTLLDATEKSINQLISAQRSCEELYIFSTKGRRKCKKAESIKIKENKPLSVAYFLIIYQAWLCGRSGRYTVELFPHSL